MAEDEDENAEDKDTQTKRVSQGLKRYWRKKRISQQANSIVRNLRAPRDPIELEKVPFVFVAEAKPAKFGEILDLLVAQHERDRHPREVLMAATMLGAWLAAPNDGVLHREVLLSYIRSEMERLEGVNRSSDIREQTISSTSARLRPRYRLFYEGIFKVVGGPSAVGEAETLQASADRRAQAAHWLFETIAMYGGLHVMWERYGPDQFSKRNRARKGYQIVQAIKDSEFVREIESCLQTGKGEPLKIRQEQTIENNLKDAGFAPMVAYAAYSLRDKFGRRLLNTILYSPEEVTKRCDDIETCLKMARFVHDELTPKTLTVSHEITSFPDPLEFPAPTMSETAILEILKIADKLPGRPRRR